MGTFIKSKFTSTDLTAPKLIVDYAYDNFERADGVPGSTPTGNYPWTKRGAIDYNIKSGVLVADVASAAGLGNELYITTPETNGRLTTRIPNTNTAGSLVGVVFRASSATTGYVFYGPEGGNYALRRREGTMTTLVATTKAPAAGDEIEIVLDGSRIICKVNGITVADVTDATHNGTQKGVWVYDAAGSINGRWDYFAWSAL